MTALTPMPLNLDQLMLAAAQPARQVRADQPVWIFGAGNFGQDLCRAMQKNGVSVAGFIETTPRAKTALNLPIKSWSELTAQDRQAQLALGILNRAAAFDQLIELATAAGFDAVVMPWDSYDQFGADLGWRFWLSTRAFLQAHLPRMRDVLARLGDDTSRNVLLRLMAFRLGVDLDFASVQSAEPQYFNELTLPALRGRAITYVDCGAYNGDTYIDLARQDGIRCQQALLLEPDPANYAALARNMAGQYPEAVCLPLAAAEQYTILSFNSGQGEGGSISATGDQHIAATALDQLLPQGHVDLIKLDVEGAEAQVLRGARNLIARSRPVLALSLYHNPQDIWELPELLFELCDGYDFYIRQHFFNSFDCVLYAIPAKR
ncbi:hypothetical protein JCM19000A_17030 [Silvimonas sp. JCM 19000]